MVAENTLGDNIYNQEHHCYWEYEHPQEERAVGMIVLYGVVEVAVGHFVVDDTNNSQNCSKRNKILVVGKSVGSGFLHNIAKALNSLPDSCVVGSLPLICGNHAFWLLYACLDDLMTHSFSYSPAKHSYTFVQFDCSVYENGGHSCIL